MFSIIIVNWNTKDLTEKCIRSVQKYCKDFELIVVDNASSDGSVELLRKMDSIILVENDKNVGYARANNQAMKLAKGEYFLLLNSDAELTQADTLEKALAYFQQDSTVGVLGAKLVFPNGRVQSLGRSFLTLRRLIFQQLFFSFVFRMRKKADDGLYPVDYVDGAFLATPRQVVKKIGLLNENYFMYAEDMEWCMRAGQNKYQIAVMPDVTVVHHHAASSRKNFSMVLVQNALNNSAFIGKFYSRRHAAVAFYIYIIGMALRIPLSFLRGNGLAGDYWQGMKMSIKELFTGNLPWQE